MPYVRSEVPPSVRTTAELHRLSSEQEFAFRIIMNTMDKHLAGRVDVEQLTLSIIGNAGEFG
jgi:hypothetical protein